MKLDLYFTPCTNMHCTWIKTKVKRKIMKWLEKNIGEYLYDIEIGKEFLNKIKGSEESPLQQHGGPERMDSEPFPLKNVSLSRVL